MNNHPLRILYAGTAEGIQKADQILTEGGLNIERMYIEESQAMVEALNGFRPEIIVASISNSDLSTRSPLSTAELFAFLLKENSRVPVLLIVPEFIEDLGIALLDRGASDYILLENLKRLPYAIRNLVAKYHLELEDAQNYGYLFEQNLAGLYTASVGGELLKCNQAFANMLGYDQPDEILGKDVIDFYLIAADREAFLAELRKHGKLSNYEIILVRKDGTPCYLLENIHWRWIRSPARKSARE